MNSMTPRERVLAALRHEEPDRIPIDLGGTVTTIETVPFNDLKAYLGKNWETRNFRRDHVDPPEELLAMFGVDTRYVRPKSPKNFKRVIEPDNSYVDDWGTRWKKFPSSLYWDPVDYPLKNATIDDLKTYPWPDPDDPGRTEGLREEAKRLREKTDYAIIADEPVTGVFENALTCIRGMEQLFIDIAVNKPFVIALLEKLTEVTIRIFKNYLDAVGEYIDVIMTSDDLAGTKGPFISPKDYSELVKPFQKRVFQAIKDQTDAYVFYHCCGNVYPLIPDFIEIGVDILNPVQVSAKDMDTKRLKREFGDKITFWGGIDSQEVLPFGSPDDVEEEVRKRIADLAPRGGYVFNAVHNIQAGVQPENICRMFEAAKKYGRYPIRI